MRSTRQMIADEVRILRESFEESLRLVRQDLLRVPNQYSVAAVESEVHRAHVRISDLQQKVNLLEHFTPFMKTAPKEGLPKYMYRVKMPKLSSMSEDAEPEYFTYEAVPVCPLCKKDTI